MSTKDHASEIPRISDMEWEVMKPLWKHGPMAARDIYIEIPGEFGWAYETVKTMLARLVKKKALTYVQVGNSYLYQAAYSRQDMSREATGSFVDRVFDGATSLFFTHFVEKVSPAERAALKAELERFEQNETPKRRKPK